MTSNTRSALILFSETIIDGKKNIHILLGMGREGLTTIGGRRERGDGTDIACLIREVKEESKGILDYSLIPEYFNIKPQCEKISHNNCLYVFSQTSYSKLKEISNSFQNVNSNKTCESELISLEIVEIHDLLIDLVKNQYKFSYNKTFKEMFLNAGYDQLKGIIWNKKSKKIIWDVNLNCDISTIPEYISLHPIQLSRKCYGVAFSKTTNFYIYDQYYGEINGEHIFRR